MESRQIGRSTQMLQAALARAGKDRLVHIVAHNAQFAEVLHGMMRDLTPIAPDKATQSTLVYGGTEFRFVSAAIFDKDRVAIRGPVFTDHAVAEHR